MTRCVLLTNSGVAFDEVMLSHIAVGDKLQTKKGETTVERVDFGESLTYVYLTF